jgi:NhaP-type Na+/H+ or K+/H+ antiporter
MFVTWCLIVGVLLIFVGLSNTLQKRLPVSTSLFYLAAGYVAGPQGLGYIDLRLPTHAPLLEILTEVAVLISLFAVGLRLRARISERLWLAPVMLATAAMALTVGLMTLAGMAVGLSIGASLLLAAVLAPTDPVLASDVQVRNVSDRDRLRFSLTGEAGLNDGTAFPFVMLALGLLGLHELGPGWRRWWAIDVVWATLGGLAIGWILGLAVSKLVVYLRRERDQALGMQSFLTLGLIAITYGVALSVSTYGFLAVFAAGLSMRSVERNENPQIDPEQVPSVATTDGAALPAEVKSVASAHMAREVLDFTLELERLAELAVMLLIGGLLTKSAFTLESIAIAAALIFVARPIAVYATTFRSRLSPAQRRLAAWFGIRGIGSMYYLSYAISHGADSPETPVVVNAVLVTIVLSVLLHGSSATPIMEAYRRARPGRRGAAGSG